MDYTFSTLLNFLIIVPVIVGCIRIRNMDVTYYPFFFLMIAGFLHELTSTILVYYKQTNISVYNTYTLVETIFICLQFFSWTSKRKDEIFFGVLMLIFLLFWIIENFIFFDLVTRFNSYFIIFYSFIVVLLSVDKLSGLIASIRQPLIKHPMFLICIGFTVFFTYSIIVEIFWLYGLDTNITFAAKVYDILAFINLLMNSLFVLAILWIPRRQNFILPSL